MRQPNKPSFSLNIFFQLFHEYKQQITHFIGLEQKQSACVVPLPSFANLVTSLKEIFVTFLSEIKILLFEFLEHLPYPRFYDQG